MAQNKQELEIDLKVNADNLNQGIKQARGDFQSYITAIKTALAGLPDGRSILGKSFKQAKEEAKALIKQLQELDKRKNVTQAESQRAGAQVQTFGKNFARTTDRALFEQNKRDIDRMSQVQREAYARTIQDDVRYRKELTYTQQLIRNEYKETEKAIRAQETAKKQEAAEQNSILRANEESINKSITLRYALYDVASTLQVASAAALRYGTTVFDAAIQQEKAFSKIEKTQIGVPQGQIDALRKELVGLTTEIPRSFEEITDIGMLGAQLGIATKDIAGFTETVAKFSTVTGVGVEETALAFGKLSSILKVSSSDFDKLGASIALVGVNGASTETQILNTAKQIGAVANAAGFSASEVVGLSSAMASLSIAPEEARGVMIQTFQAMDRAVRSLDTTMGQGNETLKTFAEIAGVSAADFGKAWSDKTNGGAGQIFKKFVTGLGNTDISDALYKLDLDGIRTSKGLTALGNNAEFVASQIKDALTGFEGGTFLDESFATTVEDIASKLKMMESAFTNLLAAAGGNEAVMGFFGLLIDALTITGRLLTDVVNSSKILSGVLGGFAGIAVIGGILLGIAAAVATAIASFLALRVAANSFANNPEVAGGLSNILGKLMGIKVAAATAATDVAKLGPAGVAAGTGLTAGGTGARWFAGGLRSILSASGVGLAIVLTGIAIEGLINLFTPAEEGLDETADGIKGMGDEADDAEPKLRELKDTLRQTVEWINNAVMPQYKLQDALSGLGKSLRENGKDFSAFTEGGRSNMGALEGVIDALRENAKGDMKKLYLDVLGFMRGMKAEGLLTADAMGYLSRVLRGLKAGIDGPIVDNGKILDISTLLNSLTGTVETAKSAVDQLGESIDSAFAKLSRRMDVASSLDAFKKGIIESGSSFSILTDAGRANITALRATIDSLAKASNGNKVKFVSDMKSLKIAMQEAGLGGARAMDIINRAIKATGVNAKASSARVKEFGLSLKALDAQRVVGVAGAMQQLSSTVTSYLDARWSMGNSQMEIAAGWEKVAQQTNKAKKEIEDISDEIAGLAADRSILEYQLGIAIKYGDTLRANELRAKIAELNQKEADIIASNQQAIAEATTSATPASDLLDQQKALQEMVGLYIQANVQKVVSAKNDTEAKKSIKEIVAGFKEQATAAGISEENVRRYAIELREGLKLARELNKPAEYKINARTKAALRDIEDFAKDANAAINSIKTNLTVSVNTKYQRADGGVIRAAEGGRISGPGSGTSDSIPAMLSNGEYVVRAAAVSSYGLDFMNALNNMTLGQSYSTNVVSAPVQSSGMVYLSPEDRNLLRQAIDRPINLYTENTKIAQSANNGNVLLAQRGLA